MAMLLTLSTSAFAQLGSLSSDLVFVPITPCRIVDTRGVGSSTGVIPAGNSRKFLAWNGTYVSQGGSPTNCNMPFSRNVAAVALNLLVIAPTAEGWIAAYPAGATRPNVSNLNFKAGDVLANSAILKVNQDDTVGGGFEWELYTTSTTHFVADVTGYFIKPAATALECINTTPDSIAINQGPSNGVYWAVGPVPAACSTGYTSVSLDCSSDNAMASVSKAGINAMQCAGNSNANTYRMYSSRTCCRVPGR